MKPVKHVENMLTQKTVIKNLQKLANEIIKSGIHLKEWYCVVLILIELLK